MLMAHVGAVVWVVIAAVSVTNVRQGKETVMLVESVKMGLFADQTTAWIIVSTLETALKVWMIAVKPQNNLFTILEYHNL